MMVTEQRRPGLATAPDRERVHWVRSTAEAAPLLDQLAGAMAAAGYAEKECFGMRLALEEAVANAVKHGHRGDPSKRVRVRVHVTADCVLAEVEDQGEGFDRAQVADPLAPENLERGCGRGLLLMESLVTWCRFNRRGNRVTLCQSRADA
jgi:serine/threonine-protein kinase RsbW